MKRISTIVLATFAVGAAIVTGTAHAAPASVQREDGPCYPYETESADGKLYCSHENGVWTSKALSTAPKVSVGSPCPKLGARARARENHGIVECQQTEQGLRWRNIR